MSYATPGAYEAAAHLGASASAADFRGAFLAITGALLGEATGARYLGPTWRDRECWRVCLAGQNVQAIYDPDTATIITVLPLQRQARGRTAA